MIVDYSIECAKKEIIKCGKVKKEFKIKFIYALFAEAYQQYVNSTSVYSTRIFWMHAFFGKHGK